MEGKNVMAYGRLLSPAPTITVSNSTRNLDDKNVAILCKISKLLPHLFF